MIFSVRYKHMSGSTLVGPALEVLGLGRYWAYDLWIRNP